MKPLFHTLPARLTSSLLIGGCLLTGLTIASNLFSINNSAQAQTSDRQTSGDLYYTFYGRQIPLRSHPDTIAVQFRPEDTSTRGRGGLPLYLQLQQDLQGDVSLTRGDRRIGGASESNAQESIDIDVQPLGDRLALITLPNNSRSRDTVRQRIQQQSYVDSTLPVLVLDNGNEGEGETTVVLPNEIVVSFEPDLPNSTVQHLLYRHNLEIIRPLQFTDNRYLVRSRSESGLAVLNASNQLNLESSIQSATPNFVQSIPYQVQQASAQTPGIQPNATARLQQFLASLPTLETPFTSNLLPLAWHLNSTPYRGRFQSRTDIHATEAWEESNGGEGAVVAVIDSLIQWDHPNLAERVHTVSDTAGARLPGEVHGWDFSSNQVVCSTENRCVSGDPDTRISEDELAVLRPHFQNTFRLDDASLLDHYDAAVPQIRGMNPNFSDAEVASFLRNSIRDRIAAEFHGTWSAGVIAAHPAEDQGTMGVAPNAEILPVRVFGLGGEITAARLIEAVGYAAARDVDVINLSLGSLMPHQDLVDQIFHVLDHHPNLVMIASAGNDSLDGVGFPAATPGVISVGATSVEGRRTFYSSYGGRLDLVAPGGETSRFNRWGILTTGGTWVDGFWQGMEAPDYGWAMSLDPQGYYVQVQGTSFSAPAVAGIAALMKGVNPDLERDRLSEILKDTARYEGLELSQGDRNRYRLQREVGMTFMDDRLSGVFPLPDPVSAAQYFFGAGLVNAEAAVREAR